MRLVIRVLGVSLPGTMAILACASPAGPPKAMTIKGFAFTPATIDVTKGTVVTWTNEDTVTHGDHGHRPADLSTAPQRRFTFNDAGTFNYFCAVHPAMLATITVW